jgi:MshEN domain
MTTQGEFPETFMPVEQDDSFVRAHRQREALVTLLAEAGAAPPDELRAAIVESAGSGEPFEDIVLRRGWVDETGLAKLLARQWGLAYLDVDGVRVDPNAAELLAADEARRLEACPIGFDGETAVLVVAEPGDSRFDEIRAALGRKATFAVVSRSGLDRLLGELDTAEPASPVTSAPAEPARDDPDTLLADIDQAAVTIAALRGRVQDLAQRQRQTEAELADSRSKLDAVESELGRKQEHQRDLFATLKAKLIEVAHTLDDAG